MRLYWWPTEQWRLFSYWGEILLVICPLLFHLTPSLLTGCDSLFYSPSALPPHSLSSPLFPAFSLIVSHHDSIHNVILVVFQRTDGFGSWHIGLSHHQLNVSLLKASLIHLMYRKKERSKDKERFQNIRFNGCWNRYSETIVQKINTSSSSSSLSSLMVRLGGTGGAKGEEVTGTLNFSAAALWACWDRSSIWGEKRTG